MLKVIHSEKCEEIDGVGDLSDLRELERKAEEELDKLLEERQEANERRRQVERDLEALREVQEEERSTKSFSSKLWSAYKKEDMFALVEEKEDPDTREKEEIEHREIDELKRIAAKFYQDLWSRRRIRPDKLQEMISRITRKIDEKGTEACEAKITIAEVKAIHSEDDAEGQVARRRRHPAEFYQKFEFVVDWLEPCMMTC